MTIPAPANTPDLERAFALRKELESAELTIIESKNQFLHKDFSGFTDCAISANSSDPQLLEADVASQQSFLKKLKFHYIQQHAKDKYIKTIVSPDEPDVDADTNKQLEISNEEKKRLLKADKVRLAETYDKIRQRALEVEQGEYSDISIYQQASSTTQEAAELTQKILDARLALTRLHAAHPAPRLTLDAAAALADRQQEEMGELDIALNEQKQKAENLKHLIKTRTKELERLKAESSVKEEELKRTQRLEEDNRWPTLNNWYSAAVSLHKSLMSLESFETPTDNELRVTYALPKGRRATLQLIFKPGTRQLAEASLLNSSFKIDIQELVSIHAISNDVPGLLRAVLARLRAEV
ncbi:hypothetical protein Clacol_009132 [Clathrus columnatus]|uniref:Kinetochore protein Sos7 coiled-coil domain-containing protein n=1 Tax=Clathrus columnatus TaxID=1419009 RepID=A0AAV5AJQ3_9AGAM|nr:hypothetical protein Clacol_009132 [Clathrus columnatus]